MAGLPECTLLIVGFAFIFYCYSCSPILKSQYSRYPNKVKPPPVYGPWYLPGAVRGIMAMFRLGMDEDEFLLSLRRDYGPLVYIPWPMKQIFVLEGPFIQKVYATPSTMLAFEPIRRGFQTTAFGSPERISQSHGIGRIFTVIGKGLATIRLDAPIERFAHVVKSKVEELKERIEASVDHTVEVNFVKWVVDMIFEAGTSGLFGDEFRERAIKANLQDAFNAFDSCFPLLASEMVPLPLQPLIPTIAKGIQGRIKIQDLLAKWVEDGMPGLDEGVFRDVTNVGLEGGYSTKDIASILVGGLWALQANAPYIAIPLILHILQSDLLPRVLQEIDSIPQQDDGLFSSSPTITLGTLSPTPRITSCIHETIRLNTSTFSIRVVQKEFVLSCSENEAEGGYLIPNDGTRVVCITRAAHLRESLWGEHPETWIGNRFIPQGEGDERVCAERARVVNGFGGGISVCEGRHLATAELKTILILLLSNFDITPLYQIANPSVGEVIGKWGVGKAVPLNGIQPSRDPTRPGLGAFQFGASDVRVKVKLRFKRSTV